MQLELRELKDGSLEQEYCCGSDEFPVLQELQGDNVRFEQPICFQLRLQKSGQIVEVDGQLQTRVELVCGRCLQPFAQDLRSDFSLTFTPLPVEREQGEAEEIELDADELGLICYKDETLDLLQPLQEQIVMALPLRPLCDSGCQGLCPECGCNLNIEHCNCEKKPFNNRFAALAKLKTDHRKTES